MRSPKRVEQRKPDIPGGKVEARLGQFEHERGFVDEEVQAAPTEAFAAAPMDADLPIAPSLTRTGPYLKARPEVIEFEAMAASALAFEMMAAPVPQVEQAWRPLGPSIIPHGQTYGSGLGSRPSVAGRVSSVAVDPTDEDHILIGAAGGGVWETHNAGVDWAPRTDDQVSLTIGAIAFDPSDPRTVYAGTGEGDALWQLGAGLLRSTDGGGHWQTHATVFEGDGFYDLLVDPLDGAHLVAGTRTALYESKDGGVTWAVRRDKRTWRLSMHPPIQSDPTSTSEVFAACEDGLFRSTDGGTSWAAVDLPGGPANWTARGNRLEVCHAPSNGNVVFVSGAGNPVRSVDPFSRKSSPTPYLWRRSLFGDVFEAISPPTNLSTGQAFYDWFLAVSPGNSNVVFWGAISVWRGVRSPDGTWSWQDIARRRLLGDSIHPDQHAIAFSPADPNVIYIGNDGGIFRSPDGGVHWQSLNKGLGITEFQYIAHHPEFESFLIAGLQDNGTVRYEGEGVWFHVDDGDGGGCGVNAASPRTCFHSYWGMGLERSTQGGGRDTWKGAGISASARQNYPNGALFYPPVAVHNDVVVQAGATVFISNKNGASTSPWAQVDLPAGRGVASALAIPSADRIFVGTHWDQFSANGGHVFRIDFTNDAWQNAVQLTRPSRGYVSDIVVDPNDVDRIWVSYSLTPPGGSAIFRSEDGGQTWVEAANELPADIAVNAIEIDPDNPDTLWAAMDVGVWRSMDAGDNWSSFSRMLPNALVKDLLFHRQSRLLRAATQSRGVWEIDVDHAKIPEVELYLRDSAVDTGRTMPSPSDVRDPFNPDSHTHWFQCKDLKIDVPPFRTSGVADLDFEIFEDDRGRLATGLLVENLGVGNTARVFVQVHNRGPIPAEDVAVKVFFTEASVGFPNLPDTFWDDFPENTLPAGSPWQPIAPHKMIPLVTTERSQIVGFEWDVPANLGPAVSLLTVISAANDELDTSELNVTQLVRNNKKCGLKNLTVVNPTITAGSSVMALPLIMWGSDRAQRFDLETDRGARGMIQGIVFSKRLSEVARQKGLPEVEVGEEARAELDWLLRQRPELAQSLDLSTAYRVPRRGRWLQSLQVDAQASEPLVVLVEPRPQRGHWSLIQRAEDGTELGGFTLQSSES